MSGSSYDVIVVGAGNAALCAALAAHESGARLLALEKATESEKGGNSYIHGRRIPLRAQWTR
jgi:tricarballylate dehydrogenase